MNSIDVLGLPVVTIGDTLSEEDSDRFSNIVYISQQRKIYRKILFKEEALVSAILIGRSEDAGIIHTLIQGQIRFDKSEWAFGLGSLRNRSHHLIYGG
jgi:NAD(P)H-nitrite reductase large subunit